MTPGLHEGQPQGPFAGSRCLAAPANYWETATVRRVNEDGTFTVEFDVKEMTVLPLWYGVTPEEVSFDDVSKWPAVYARLGGGPAGFSRADMAKALPLLGYRPDEEQLSQFW